MGLAPDEIASLEARMAGPLDDLSAALFATGNWRTALAALAERAGFVDRARGIVEGLLTDEREQLSTENDYIIEGLMRALAGARDAQAFDTLKMLSRMHPSSQVRSNAAAWLFWYGSRGWEALAGPVGSEPGDSSPRVNRIRMRAAFRRGDPFEALSGGSTARRQAVLEALRSDLQFFDRESKKRRPELGYFEKEPRWLEWTARQMLDATLRPHAEVVLASQPRATWQPVVDAVRRAARVGTPKRGRRPGKKSLAKLETELRRLAEEIATIAASLTERGYVFVGTPLSPRAPDFADKLQALEGRIGAVPASLQLFWKTVGAVDLRGHDPSWERTTFYTRPEDEPLWLSDPLCVYSIDVALEEALDSDFDAADVLPDDHYGLVISGDAMAKAGYSGGVLLLRTPNPRLDATVEPTGQTVLEMIQHAVRWRGFPGFAHTVGRPPEIGAEASQR